MIHKNGNALDLTVTLPLKNKLLLLDKDHIINDSSKIIDDKLENNDEVSVSTTNNDNNNNDYIDQLNDVESVYAKCMICKKVFSSAIFLDEHIYEQHPNFKLPCEHCGKMFTNLKFLIEHNIMHMTEKHTMQDNRLNFKILNYLENKKNEFYQKLVESVETSQTYKCNFCHRYFTGSQIMLHWKQCKHFPCNDRLRLITNKRSFINDENSIDDEMKSNFLAELNLQYRRDIQIFSNCNSSKYESKNNNILSPSKLPDMPVQNDSSFDNYPSILINEQNDINDPFKVEVRDMKRRGEFPCRICKKIFRNLRALKGHARVHISGNRGMMPYECNICSFTTTDKSVIIRHIRNHNGDHPYKCQLCLSTFTTKANCERHLRNAHRKTSREDIKNLLIDLNNKPSVLNYKNKLQNLLITGPEENIKNEFNEIAVSKQCKNDTSKYENDGENKIIDSENKMNDDNVVKIESTSDIEDSSDSNDSNNNNSNSNFLKKYYDHSGRLDVTSKEIDYGKYSNYYTISTAGLLDMQLSKPKYECYNPKFNNVVISCGSIQDNNGSLKIPFDNHAVQQNEYAYPEEPLDLSVDVLDLSKKKDTDKEEVKDLSVKLRNCKDTLQSMNSSSLSHSPVMSFLAKNSLHCNFNNTRVISDLSSFFISNSTTSTTFTNKFGRSQNDGSVETTPPNISPQIFNHLLTNATEQYNEIRQNFSASIDIHSKIKSPVENFESNKCEEKENEKISPQLNKKNNNTCKPLCSYNNKSSSVKIVMKDGVLIEKQKQRRYRTEKPFTCEYCPGRFTLRSNMDRHVKQQHPAFYRQRQRGGMGRLQHKATKEKSPDLSVPLTIKQESPPMLNTQLKIYPDEAASNKNNICSELKEIVCKKKKVLPKNELISVTEKDEDEKTLVIDEEISNISENIAEETLNKAKDMKEENPDLASVRSLLDNVSMQTFSQYFSSDDDPNKHGEVSEDDEDELVGESNSDENGSGGEENKVNFEPNSKNNVKVQSGAKKKKSAYSSAPNRVHCDFCYRSFPWASSLRRHTLTHTGQKPYKCSNCPLLFTTKSNCDRHFLRKHRSQLDPSNQSTQNTNLLNNTDANNKDQLLTIKLMSNFFSRNVPERPFKCNNCVSSTFSTYNNLKKHIIEKHKKNSTNDEQSSENKNIKDDLNSDDNTSYETCSEENKRQDQHFNSLIASDLPFKCHLCDRTFSERQEALNHISESHADEFQHLVCKGALNKNVKLENNVSNEEIMFQSSTTNSDENSTEQHGRFPDYSSRKVVCAFCLRRFWSAEDLRRHMRTHSGERPFVCDLCQRRFTLKHSMLRHRKKHSNNSSITSSASYENSLNNSEDDELSSPLHSLNEPIKLSSNHNSELASINKLESIHDLSSNDDKTTVTLSDKINTDQMIFSKLKSKEDGVDLIAKLLDIEDKSLVDEMLTSKSADDVAKLLGVNK